MMYYQLHTILYIVELHHWNRSISYSTQLQLEEHAIIIVIFVIMLTV